MPFAFDDPATRHHIPSNKTQGDTSLTPLTEARRRPGPRPGTVQAKNGGFSVRDRYGKDFFRRIGRKGGAAMRDRRGTEYFAAIGRLGGQATLQRLGTEHFGRIGRMSAERTRSIR
jgi:hypothetical protein